MIAISTIAELINRRIDDTPALESLTAPSASGAQLHDAASRLAAELSARGVERRDRVAVVSPNGPTMVTAFLGTTMAGACAPLNASYGRAELEFFVCFELETLERRN